MYRGLSARRDVGDDVGPFTPTPIFGTHLCRVQKPSGLELYSFRKMSSLAQHMTPIGMSEIQMATVPQLSMEIPEESRNGGIPPGSGLEAIAVDDQDTYGASSSRSRVQLTATLLALFVRGPFPVCDL